MRRDTRWLREWFERAWAAETSVDPSGWSPTNPSWGQCAVTALNVQDIYGGKLMRAVVNGDSHYWNVTPDGQEIDLTKDQFGGEFEPIDVQERARFYVLSFPETAKRYHLLAARMNERG